MESDRIIKGEDDDNAFDAITAEGAVLRRAILRSLLPALLFADSASAEDALKIQPDSYRIAFENDQLRVLDFVSRPGMGVCGIGMHSHPAHLTVVLSDGKVRVGKPDGTSFVGEGHVGDVFWSEAETHTTENLSSRNARGLIIELKARKA